ncbi:hypothetical protein KAU11_08080 [Candidatus Babeliales bacterium]|nr:hypothetical protein [Candidatus Babeliales bacterium]
MPIMNLRTSKLFVGGIEVEIGEGNLTYSEKRPLEYVTNGNEISEVREADEEALDLKMDFTWKRVAGDFAALIDKIDNRSGTQTSSDAIECRPYAVDVQVRYPDACLTESEKNINYDDFRYETLDYDAKAGTISVSGKCNISYPTITDVV